MSSCIFVGENGSSFAVQPLIAVGMVEVPMGVDQVLGGAGAEAYQRTRMSVISFGRMGRPRQQPDLDPLHKQFLVSHCLKRGLASSKKSNAKYHSNSTFRIGA